MSTWRPAIGRWRRAGFRTCGNPARCKVAIIGQTVALQLFGDADPIDQVIRLKRVPRDGGRACSRKKGQNAAGQDQDDVVIVPITTYRNRVQGARWPAQVGAVHQREGDGKAHSMKEAEEGIKALLRQRFRVQPGADDPFSIRNLTEILRRAGGVEPGHDCAARDGGAASAWWSAGSGS